MIKVHDNKTGDNKADIEDENDGYDDVDNVKVFKDDNVNKNDDTCNDWTETCVIWRQLSW